MELFNEWMICMITYPCFCFSDALPDKDNQFIIGWLLSFVFVIHIVGNVQVVILDLINNAWLSIVKKFRLVCRKYGWF